MTSLGMTTKVRIMPLVFMFEDVAVVDIAPVCPTHLPGDADQLPAPDPGGCPGLRRFSAAAR
jgi:hypothetical protein